MTAHLEAGFADAIAKQYRADGYQILNPQAYRSKLPTGYVPDLMLKKGREIVVVEIKPPEEHKTVGEVRALKAEIEKNPQWRFRLLVPPTERETPDLEDNLDALGERVDLAAQLTTADRYEEAYVVLWMVIEVCLRRLLTDRQSRPNLGVSGMSMARGLYGFGDLEPDELRLLESAYKARNQAVHGFRLQPLRQIEPSLFSLARGLIARVRSNDRAVT